MILAQTKTLLDGQIQHFIETLWQDGESISLAGDIISSVQYFQPSCKGHLQGSWKLLRTWQRHELPSRAPPLTWHILLVVLGYFQSRHPQVALALHLAFRALLRTGELLALESKDMVLSPTTGTAVLYLGLTKTGARNPAANSVSFKDFDLIHRLHTWKSALQHTVPLIPWSATYFRTMFATALRECHLSTYQFKPYSLRRGGATDLWLSCQNYSLVAHTGRWSSERTLKVYIQESMSLLTSFHFRATPRQRYLQQLYLASGRVEPPSRRKGWGRGRGV